MTNSNLKTRTLISDIETMINLKSFKSIDLSGMARVYSERVQSRKNSKADRNSYRTILIHNSFVPRASYFAKVRKSELDMDESEDSTGELPALSTDIFRSLGGFDAAVIYCEHCDLHKSIIDEYEIKRWIT